MEAARPPTNRRVSLQTKILLGLVLGAASGVVANWLSADGAALVGASPRGGTAALSWIVDNVATPVGQIFLNMLFMVVIPIVFTSISVGVAHLGSMGRLGRLGTRTLLFFLLATTISCLGGIGLALVLRPGEGFEPAARASLMEEFGEQARETAAVAARARIWPDLLVGIVSRNPLRDAVELNMLPVIFFAILFGLGLTLTAKEKAEPALRVLEGIGEAMVFIVGFAMRIAPYAVFALIFRVTALFGWSILLQLSYFVTVVLVGYVVHLFGFYGLVVKLLAGIAPRAFFRKITPIMVTALSTSSSAATLPTTIKITEEELAVPDDVAGFVLPLGATTNMNGTALFEGVVFVFLAQIFGVSLGLGGYLVLVVLSILTAVGAAGVPSGAIPLMVVVLETLGIPGEAIAIVIGVDRILDMGRTVLNVTGDVAAACVLARGEGVSFKAE